MNASFGEPTRVLFVCVKNACRSQMAEGFARHLAGGAVDAHSAGSEPAREVDPAAVKVMAEAGIDIAEVVPKGFGGLRDDEFDIVVLLGCQDRCPDIPARRRVEWDVEDPAGRSLSVYRVVRDDVERRVRALLGIRVSSGDGEAPGMMERHFDEELRDLKDDLLRMAAMIEDAVEGAMTALSECDRALAETVIAGDSRIDEQEVRIEEMVVDLLARRQPVAIDLRFVTTAMHINVELERIGDLAVNIAQVVAYDLAGRPQLKPLVDIPKLWGVAKEMLLGAIDSFVNRDKSIAARVIRSDERADALRNEVQRELINDFLLKDGSTAPRAVPLLLVARHLERVCDHATNIAEDVIYMIEAEIVRHHPERLAEIEPSA